MTKNNRRIELLWLCVSLLTIGVCIYVRCRLLSVPLERDEGEYAYMGQLLLRGVPPYLHAYSMKLPGVSCAYALFMAVFGESPTAIHAGLLIVNLTCTTLLWLLSDKLWGRVAATAAAASFAVLSLSYSVLGVFAHATHFVVLFYLCGFFLLLKHLDSIRFWHLAGSGVSFGLAVLMKQHAALIVAFALAYLVCRRFTESRSPVRVAREAGIFAMACALPYLAMVLVLWQQGVIDKFWFWTVSYARQYASGLTFAQGSVLFKSTVHNLLTLQLPLWLLSVMGIIALLIDRRPTNRKYLLLGLLVSSFLAVTPGLYFRDHYFVLILPAVAMLIAVAASAPLYTKTVLFSYAMPLLFTFAVCYGFYQERQYSFTFSPRDVSRAVYTVNPFLEAVEVADYISRHTESTDHIAVLGSEPEIYFYAGRLSATGHIYMYGLMEDQPFAEQMQREMIKDLETALPKFVVMTNASFSWAPTPASRQLLFNWMRPFLREKYQQCGVAEILSFRTTRYLWGEQAVGYTPRSESSLVLYKRKDI